MEEKNTSTENVEKNSASTAKSGISATNKFLTILLVFAIAAFVVWYVQNKPSTEVEEIDFNMPGIEQSLEDIDFAPTGDYPDVVAVVNGEEITKEDFTVAYVQMAQSAYQQGADITDMVVISEIEVRVMDILTSTALLTQASNAAGNSIEDSEVEAELALIESQFESPEDFANTVAETGLTIEDVKSEIHDRLLIDDYLSSVEGLEDITISEEEVQEIYDTYFAGTEEAPEIDVVYSQIEQQLIAQKQQEIIESKIDELEANATIETNI